MEEGPGLKSTVVTVVGITFHVLLGAPLDLVFPVCQALLLCLHVRVLTGSLPTDGRLDSGDAVQPPASFS